MVAFPRPIQPHYYATTGAMDLFWLWVVGNGIIIIIIMIAKMNDQWCGFGYTDFVRSKDGINLRDWRNPDQEEYLSESGIK